MELTIQTDAEVDALYIAFGSHTGERGIVKKTQRVGEDIGLDFDANGRLVGLELLNASEHLGATIDEVHIDELIGVKEAAALVGVQRSNFVRDYADKPGFPAPVVELGTGRIWLRSQVLQYVAGKANRRAS